MSVNTRPNKELQILEGAARAFARRGFHHATMADVAREAGVATGTLYLYVSQKEALLGLLFRTFLGKYLDLGEPLLEATEPGVEQLRLLVERHFAFFAENPDLATVFQLHLREIHPDIRAGIEDTTHRYFAIVDRVIQGGIASGAFDPKLDLRAARNIVFGGLDATVTAWVLSERRFVLRSQIDPLTDMLTRALSLDATPF